MKFEFSPKDILDRIVNFFGDLRSLLSGVSMAFALLGVVGVIGAGIVYLVLPELRSSAIILLALGVLLLLIFLLVAFNQVKRAMLGRRGRYSTNTAVMIFAFVGIAVVLNFLGFKNHQRFDVTASHQFSLAPQTVKILKELDQEVQVTGFFAPGYPDEDEKRAQAESLLKEYSYHTDEFSYRFIDYEANPAIARQYEIAERGSLVFESGERRQQVTAVGETDFTSAILKVIGKQQKKIYFLTGHDEHDINTADENGYSYAKDGAQGDNYQVETLSLATKPEVPEDAAAIVIAGARKPLLPDEITAIENYLKGGGNALVLLDPNPPKELVDIVGKWGVEVKNGTVVDQLSFAYPDVASPAIQRPQYLFSQITKQLDTTFFPGVILVKPVEMEKPPKDLTISPLANTTESSWLETTPDPQSAARFDEGQDIKGPITLAVAVEGTGPLGQETSDGANPTSAKAARIVVIGDSDFATNKFFYSLGNSDLFLNSVNWLAEEEQLISIRPKPAEFRRLVVTQRGWNWIVWSSIALLPLAVAAAGGISWWRRR